MEPRSNIVVYIHYLITHIDHRRLIESALVKFAEQEFGEYAIGISTDRVPEAFTVFSVPATEADTIINDIESKVPEFLERYYELSPDDYNLNVKEVYDDVSEEELAEYDDFGGYEDGESLMLDDLRTLLSGRRRIIVSRQDSYGNIIIEANDDTIDLDTQFKGMIIYNPDIDRRTIMLLPLTENIDVTVKPSEFIKHYRIKPWFYNGNVPEGESLRELDEKYATAKDRFGVDQLIPVSFLEYDDDHNIVDSYGYEIDIDISHLPYDTILDIEELLEREAALDGVGKGIELDTEGGESSMPDDLDNSEDDDEDARYLQWREDRAEERYSIRGSSLKTKVAKSGKTVTLEIYNKGDEELAVYNEAEDGDQDPFDGTGEYKYLVQVDMDDIYLEDGALYMNDIKIANPFEFYDKYSKDIQKIEKEDIPEPIDPPLVEEGDDEDSDGPDVIDLEARVARYLKKKALDTSEDEMLEYSNVGDNLAVVTPTVVKDLAKILLPFIPKARRDEVFIEYDVDIDNDQVRIRVASPDFDTGWSSYGDILRMFREMGTELYPGEPVDIGHIDTDGDYLRWREERAEGYGNIEARVARYLKRKLASDGAQQDYAILLIEGFGGYAIMFDNEDAIDKEAFLMDLARDTGIPDVLDKEVSIVTDVDFSDFHPGLTHNGHNVDIIYTAKNGWEYLTFFDELSDGEKVKKDIIDYYEVHKDYIDGEPPVDEEDFKRWRSEMMEEDEEDREFSSRVARHLKKN